MTHKERLETAHERAAALFREIASDPTVVARIADVDPGLAAEIRAHDKEWSEATEMFLCDPFGGSA